MPPGTGPDRERNQLHGTRQAGAQAVARGTAAHRTGEGSGRGQSELGQVEECTETILGAVGNLAKIYASDPKEMLHILRRAVGALEVVTIFLLREESDARGGRA